MLAINADVKQHERATAALRWRRAAHLFTFMNTTPAATKVFAACVLTTLLVIVLFEILSFAWKEKNVVVTVKVTFSSAPLI